MSGATTDQQQSRRTNKIQFVGLNMHTGAGCSKGLTIVAVNVKGNMTEQGDIYICYVGQWINYFILHRRHLEETWNFWSMMQNVFGNSQQ